MAADRLVGLALRAGAPDNVTCIIGDIVDLDKGEAPSTAQEVVGAAAERRASNTRAVPATPAAKAAALSREARNARGTDSRNSEQPESEALPESGTGPGLWRRLKVLSLVLLGLTAIAGGGYAAYSWSQQQYYVGEANGHVAIYQGVAQKIGPWELSHVVDQSDIALSDLPDFYRGKLDSTVSSTHVGESRRLVTDLRVQAIRCRTIKAAGGTCGTASP